MSGSKNSSFLYSLKFQNNLPSAPSGPFFKKVDLFHVKEGYTEYRTSTLEKSYIWQPHFGNDMGLNLDLVDQDSILVQDSGKNQPLDPVEIRFLNGTGEKSRGKTLQLDQEDKPWWLRNTTYMENNLFKSISKVQKEDSIVKAVNEKKLKRIGGENFDPLSSQFIDESFDIVEKTVEKIQSKQKKSKVLWSLPIIPHIVIIDDENQEGHPNYSIVRFDEDPVSLSQANNNDNKKRKINECIVTNIRSSKDNSKIDKVSFFESSLIAPFDNNDNNVDEDEQVDHKKFFDWVKGLIIII